MDWLERELKRLESGLLALLLSALIGLAFLQVALRQILGSGWVWADPLCRELVLWTGFLGAALAAAEGKHFAWEGPAPANPRLAAALRLIGQMCAAAICLALLKASARFWLEERTAGRPLELGLVALPAGAASAIIPLGFGLILAHFCIGAIRSAKAWWRP